MNLNYKVTPIFPTCLDKNNTQQKQKSASKNKNLRSFSQVLELAIRDIKKSQPTN